MNPILFFVLASVSFVSSSSVGCGKQDDLYKPTVGKITRIIGGSEAKPHSWPWQVYLMISVGMLTPDGQFVTGTASCGSNLIRVNPNKEESDIILTASHCITMEGTETQVDPSDVSVMAGAHNILDTRSVESRKASKILKHPNYSVRTLTSDVALIKLETPIKFSATIRPICLPDQGEAIPTGKFCAIAGWGRTNNLNSQTSSVLKQLAVQAQSADACRSGWSSTYSEQHMICTKSPSASESSCHGDSGGMFACQRTDGGWTLYGTDSFGGQGSNCLVTSKPEVYARVSNYADWIKSNAARMTSVK